MDRYKLSTAANRFSKSWPCKEYTWEEFLERLKNPVRSTLTMQEYLHLSKQEQDNEKDAGGYVAGTFRTKRRNANDVTSRSMITLDLDNIPAGGTDIVIGKVESLGYRAAIYSTRKHDPLKPRLRVILPLAADCTADEYEPAARKMAECIGIDYMDRTTFQASRLMYWPSVCADSEYVFRTIDNKEVNAADVLSMYNDWKNVQEWPMLSCERTDELIRRSKQKADPENVKGIVGDFCRAYDIYTAIEKFIPDAYVQTDDEDRLTYTGGSTACGAIVYENGKFLYSHHATDPCSGQLVNAFDMVRLHKFGALDDNEDPSKKVTDLPSYSRMRELVAFDDRVREEFNKVEAAAQAESIAKITEWVAGKAASEAALVDEDDKWRNDLTRDSKDRILSTVDNIRLIIENDPKLKGKFRYNTFDRGISVMGEVPWPSDKCESADGRAWKDVDGKGLFWYIEHTYFQGGKLTDYKVDDALQIVAYHRQFSPVANFIRSLPAWDGKERVETLFIRCFGAKDDPYTRAVTRKWLIAAVARIMKPGCKFDNMIILVGDQGIGKSTVFKKLAVNESWHSDAIDDINGKATAELLRGKWINELPEMTALSKKDSKEIKGFITKTDDYFRAAYARCAENNPRQCVFAGTSNDTEFLRDDTGNRRFWPIRCGVNNIDIDIWSEEFEGYVLQVWAEAYRYFLLGEELILSREMLKEAEQQQLNHRINTGWESVFDDYLAKRIPEGWESFDEYKKKQFMNGNMTVDESALCERTKVSYAELYSIALGERVSRMTADVKRRIKETMIGVSGWEADKNPRRYGISRERGFHKIGYEE